MDFVGQAIKCPDKERERVPFEGVCTGNATGRETPGKKKSKREENHRVNAFVDVGNVDPGIAVARD